MRVTETAARFPADAVYDCLFVAKPLMLRGGIERFGAQCQSDGIAGAGVELEALLDQEAVELEHTSGTAEERTPLLLGRGWWAEQEERALRLNPNLRVARRATLVVTVSNACGVASSSGIEIWYLFSRKRLSETIENESTMPPEMRGVS